MSPYLKFWLKSFSVFISAISVSFGVRHAVGQISLIDWLANLWPGIVALAVHWGTLADSTPAPWANPTTREES